MARKLVLVRIADDPPLFEPAIVLSDWPDVDGVVRLLNPAETPEGVTDRVHKSRVFEYDQDLLVNVNSLVSQASDLLEVVARELELRARPAFSDRKMAELASLLYADQPMIPN